MELRHLRSFIAVAEAGSLTVAAEQRLQTSQPSLSRQIRDLESELGTRLLTRRARGIELPPAGRAFLDHARSVRSQVAAAAEGARRVAHPAKPCFTMGFLTGHELTWMPEALRILRDELPNNIRRGWRTIFRKEKSMHFSSARKRGARVDVSPSRQGAPNGDLAE
jgi:LysR family transcriptional regulator, hca operon transcriptional activator